MENETENNKFKENLNIIMSENTPGYEHTTLRGITIKNIIVTIFCTASIVASVMGTYVSLKESIQTGHDEMNTALAELKFTQDKQNILYDVRLKAVEAQLQIIQQQVSELQKDKK